MGRRTTRAAAAMLATLAVLAGLLAGTAAAQVPTPDTPAAPSRPGKPTDMTPRLAAVASPAVATSSAAVQAAAAGLPAEGPGSLLRDPQGRLVVDVTLADGSPTGLASLAGVGAELVATDGGPVLATVVVPATALRALAALPAVAYLAEVPAPMTSAADDPGPTDQPLTDATCPTGIVTEGDVQLGAATARTTYGVDGDGVVVGVLSDSFDNLGGAATDVTDAELPGAANPCGHPTDVGIQEEKPSGGTDEGRAMAQIVHDLAPGAELRFATAFLGELDFASQITDLATGGADVITDDVFYLTEPMFQDGVIAAAINDNRTTRDVLHFSSGGNSNKVVGGKEVGSYEATTGFRPTTCPAGIPAYNNACHDFDPTAGTDGSYRITLSGGGSIRLGLGWSEPMYGVTTDLDLYLVDTTSNSVVASSETDNSSSAKANEYLDHTNSTGTTKTYDIVVGRYNASPDPTGTPRLKTVLFRATGLTAVEYDTSAGDDVIGPTLVGHSAAALTMGTAAVPFFSSSSVESFSSRGPQAICWEPVSGITPQSAKATCDEVQPDLAATDGGANSFFGSFSGGAYRFFGTSAAAPHAAAVAALARDLAPCATADDVAAAMTSSAAAVGALGTSVVGAGLVDAVAALALLDGSCPGAITGTVTVAGTGAPVAGADVLAYTDADGFAPSASTTTAADGTYTLADLPPGDRRLAIAAPEGSGLLSEWYDDAAGRGTATVVAVAPDATTAGVDVTLDVGAAITGTVTDATESPVAGITVAAFVGTTTFLPVATTTTAADGTYSLLGLAGGDHTVLFQAPGGVLLADRWYDDAALRGDAAALTLVEGATTAGVDAVLPAVAAIAGTVTAADGGAPVADAVVSAYRPGAWLPSRLAVTAADGTYVLEDLVHPTYEVVAVAPAGALLQTRWYDAADSRPGATAVSATLGATTTGVDVALPTAAALDGTVVGVAAAPVAGATIEVYLPTGTFLPEATTTTAADGSFALATLSPGSYRVRITPPGGSGLSVEWYEDAAVRSAGTVLALTGGTSTSIAVTLDAAA